MNFKKIFESENIEYVEMTLDLIDDYLEMINDFDNVGRFIGKMDPTEKEDEIEWVKRKIADKDFIFSMIEKDTGEFIGSIGIEGIADGRGELGIAITKNKQDLGYGKESIKAICGYAFMTLGLKSIFLKAFPYNHRALHVYKECGFREYDRNDTDIFLELYR